MLVQIISRCPITSSSKNLHIVFQNLRQLSRTMGCLVATLGKLNLKGLTSLRSKKKLVLGMQLHMFPEGLHNSISRHQDQKTYQITNAFGPH